MAETEAVLLKRFTGSGDAQALAEIIRRHAGLVYGAALRIVADVDRASDVAQETFLQLTKDAANVTGSLPGWLHRVATHKAIDQRRRDASRRHREREYVAGTKQPRTATEWKEISLYVDVGLRELEPELRHVLILHFLEGRTTREIALAQGTSQATVSRRIGAGVEQLRAKLRRRGVLVAVGALSALLGDNAVQAAPLPLLTELGKMAMVGGAASAGTVGAGSGLYAVACGVVTAIKTHAAAVAAVAVIGAGSAVTCYELTKSSLEPVAAVPAGLVAASPGMAAAGSPLGSQQGIASPGHQPEAETPTEQLAAFQKPGTTPDGETPVLNPPRGEAESVPVAMGSHDGMTGSMGFPGEMPKGTHERQTEQADEGSTTGLSDDPDSRDPNEGRLEMYHGVRPIVTALAILSQAAMANSPLPGQGSPPVGFAGGTALPERVLHFPPEQSVGEIMLVDERSAIPEISREFHPGYAFVPVQHLGPARGDIRIPAGKRASLHLGGKGVTRRQCFDCLQSLGPNDIQGLDFLAPLQVDDAFLPYIARLTGLTGICPVTARFSGPGWTTLKPLTGLVHICTPYGLTDDEMAGIATLQTVNEMEIVATRLTDAGLASLARLRNLQVLHLEGTPMMTDEGLRGLATLPKLRHLRLSGPFTDKGLAYLAAAPALKAMWLETPRATEDGLRSLAQIETLERLTVPWLDLITPRSVIFLRAMTNLKALGVGDAWNADAGVAALASLSNLEVLALKGSPALTDNGLIPLSAMPKLRALEIYHSRITEQGLAHLYACKKLDSVQIRSSVPVGAQALARLQTELPNLRTVDIRQSEPSIRPRPVQTARAALIR